MKHEFPDKIIFLDIDGVINTTKHRFQKFDEECMSSFEEILNLTKAKIVISSSWRDENYERMKLNFLEHGCTDKIFNEVIDITCRGFRSTIKGSRLPIVRGNEIKEWIDTRLIYPWHETPSLDKHYQILNEDGSFKMMKHNELNIDFSYLILDDDIDMLYCQKDNFIVTNCDDGITKEHIQQAVNILNYIK